MDSGQGGKFSNKKSFFDNIQTDLETSKIILTIPKRFWLVQNDLDPFKINFGPIEGHDIYSIKWRPGTISIHETQI